MSTRLDNLVKGVQCYELFGGKALINYAFFLNCVSQKYYISNASIHVIYLS